MAPYIHNRIYSYCFSTVFHCNRSDMVCIHWVRPQVENKLQSRCLLFWVILFSGNKTLAVLTAFDWHNSRCTHAMAAKSEADNLPPNYSFQSQNKIDIKWTKWTEQSTRHYLTLWGTYCERPIGPLTKTSINHLWCDFSIMQMFKLLNRVIWYIFIVTGWSMYAMYLFIFLWEVIYFAK